MTTENPFSLAGKVAVVTGGSSGIGAASVRLLAGAGARVVVGYNRGADRAAALIAELPGTGHQAMHLPLEDSAQIRKVAAAVKEGFGRTDILVNSAGFTRIVANGPRTLAVSTASIRSSSSASRSWGATIRVKPAELTRMSVRPKPSLTAAATFRIWALSSSGRCIA